MSDAESDTIFIPDPPTLPALFRDDQGIVHATTWQHAQHFVAKYNEDGTGFDVRQKTGADPFGADYDEEDDYEEEGEEDDYEEEGEEDDDEEVGEEDDDEDEDGDAHEWPIHLGPPTRSPVLDPLIHVWGLQLLDAAGFINYEQDDADDYMDPVGRLAKVRNPLGLEAGRVHPIFRKDMFQNLTDESYELILPAILLASAYLDDPTTLNFFYGVWATEQHTSFWDVDLGYCTTVHVPDTLSEDSQREIYEKILAMRQWTSWEFRGPTYLAKHGALALTRSKLDAMGKPIPASGSDTHQTVIELSKSTLGVLSLFDHHVSTGSQAYEKMLEDTLDLAGIPESRKLESFDLTSAITRTNFQLAMTMIHEFAHAFNRAYFNAPYFLFAPEERKEPWMAGSLNNELGYSLVKHILGENPYALDIWKIPMSRKEIGLQATLCPFGLFTYRRWDVGRGNRPDAREYVMPGSTDDDARNPQVCYPLPQKHVHAMYTKDMWTKHVPRYGLAALKLPQPLAWGVN